MEMQQKFAVNDGNVNVKAIHHTIAWNINFITSFRAFHCRAFYCESYSSHNSIKHKLQNEFKHKLQNELPRNAQYGTRIGDGTDLLSDHISCLSDEVRTMREGLINGDVNKSSVETDGNNRVSEGNHVETTKVIMLKQTWTNRRENRNVRWCQVCEKMSSLDGIKVSSQIRGTRD